MRLEEVRPSFDVFSLGKLFWSMVSGNPFLRLWYWDDPMFSLEALFPRNPDIFWARYILEKCVVEQEKDCLPTARELLNLVDPCLLAVSRNAQVVRQGVKRLCTVCGVGEYQRQSNNIIHLNNFGLRPAGSQSFFVFTCAYCGHVQLFSLPRGEENPPLAWKGASPR